MPELEIVLLAVSFVLFSGAAVTTGRLGLSMRSRAPMWIIVAGLAGLSIHQLVTLFHLLGEPRAVWPEHAARDVVAAITAALFFWSATMAAKMRRTHDIEVARRKVAEAALGQSQDRLATLIEETPDFICFKHGDGRWIQTNAAGLKIFDLVGVDYRGKTDMELAELRPFYRDAFAYCVKSDERAWTGRTISRAEEAVPQPDGTALVFDVIKVPRFNADGSRQALVVVGRDITERKQAEREADEQHALALQIMDTTGQAMAVTDGRGILEFVNPAFERMLATSAKDLIGHSVIEFVDPADRGIALQQRRRREQGNSETFELRMVRANGESFHALVNAVPRIRDGRVVGVIAALTDITRKHAYEQRLTRINETFLGFGADPLENVTRLTALCGELLGADCVLYNRLKDGMLCSLATWHAPADYNPIDRPEGHICTEVIASQRDVVLIPNLPETPYAASDPNVLRYGLRTYFGAVVKLGGQPHGTLCALFRRDFVADDDDRQLIGILASAVAIEEERHDVARALEKSEERYRTLAEATQDMIFIVGRDDRVEYVNEFAANQFGLRPERMVGEPRLRFFQGEAADRQGKNLRAVLESGRPLLVENATSYAGHETWQSTLLVPLRDAAGSIHAVLGVSRDVTDAKRAEAERRALEAQVQQSQKLQSLGVLAGGIAHDFNNLLMAVLGNAELALRDLSPMSPARSRLEEIKKASVRASELTRQMLAFSGKTQPLAETINLNELIEEIAHLLKVSITKKAELRYQFMEGLPAIVADASQVRQIAMNLITNASDALGPDGGVVMLSTGVATVGNGQRQRGYIGDLPAPGEYVFLEVADTGCGMDESTRARIFDPFFTTKFAGRGLGLAAVLGIVRGHKGAIALESEPGRGSTFRVLFPRASALPAPSTCPKKPAAEGWRGSGTVLVVDDEESVRDVARKLLEEFGFNVITAGDGHEAVEVFREKAAQISVVLLDMAMPRMNGEEAFRELRKIRPDARIVLASGYNREDVAERLSDQGIAGFLQKPFTLVTLIDKIREVLAQP